MPKNDSFKRGFVGISPRKRGPFASSCPHAQLVRQPGLSEFSLCALYDHKCDSGFYKDGIKSSTMGVAM